MDALPTEAPAAAKVYQDFVPPPELVEEPECDTLVVYLPGFRKEQLRIQFHKRNLVISGERPVGDNTWRRFQKTILISSNYDISKITTKFENSRLYITQPLIASAQKQDQKNPTSSDKDQKAEKQDQEKATNTKTPEAHTIVNKNEDPNKIRQKEAAAAAKVYQDFVPQTELLEEPDRDTLLVNLPGFKKEHLRVQLSKSRNLVISGEQHAGNNTWRRFQKTIPISSNCDISKITAKFEDFILHITQPKLIASAQKQDQKNPTSSHKDQKAEKQDQEKATNTKTPEARTIVNKNEDPNKVRQKEAAAAAKVHQDFVPQTELLEEPDRDTLLVYLPGFKKEHLRVQLSKSRNLVISGEQHVGNNTWRRFQKTIPISSNCDISKITAKFEDFILHITQPKLIASAQKQDQKNPTSSHKDQKAEKQDQEKATNTKTPEAHTLVENNEDPDKVKQVTDNKQPDNTNIQRKAALEEENAQRLTKKENILKNIENSSDDKIVSDKISYNKQIESKDETGHTEGNYDQKHKTDYGDFVTKLNMQKKVIKIIVAVLVAIVFVLNVKYLVGNWNKAEEENV